MNIELQDISFPFPDTYPFPTVTTKKRKIETEKKKEREKEIKKQRKKEREKEAENSMPDAFLAYAAFLRAGQFSLSSPNATFHVFKTLFLY